MEECVTMIKWRVFGVWTLALCMALVSRVASAASFADDWNQGQTGAWPGTGHWKPASVPAGFTISFPILPAPAGLEGGGSGAAAAFTGPWNGTGFVSVSTVDTFLNSV